LSNSLPLVIDLDGSLIRSDMLLESGLQFIHENPMRALAPLLWLRRGKAVLKDELARHVDIDASLLPYDPEVLALINTARLQGRETVLATASHEKYARAVSQHLQCFDRVMASTHQHNLKGKNKSQALTEAWGEGQFDYVGDSAADIPVWAAAHKAYIVSPSTDLLQKAQQANASTTALAAPRELLKPMAKAMRLQHWAKNALIFVPLLASHQADDVGLLLTGVVAFLCFGLAASSVYLINDLLDLQNDRKHPKKALRPVANGDLPIRTAALFAAFSLVLSALMALIALPGGFTATLGAYYLLTLAYSLLLKRLFLIDVAVLAILYTLRVIAGIYALGTQLTDWLLGFSLSLFLSLAMVKRYAELLLASSRGNAGVLPGRGYSSTHMLMLASLGVAAGVCSVAVLGAYVLDESVTHMYSKPKMIWLACPVLLAWIARIWIMAQRGLMQEDPVDFALHDRASILLGVLFSLIFVVAS